MFALMTNFDKSAQLEWYFNEGNYGKGPMDDVDGTMKRVVFRLLKSNKIKINTAEEFATEVSKAVPSIQPVFVSQDDEIIEPSFVKVAPYIQWTLDTHVKRSFNSNGVCFLEFHRSWNDLEPFYVQYYSQVKTLVCDHIGSENNENECGWGWNVASVSFLQDMVPWRMFWKITLQLTLKIYDLNLDFNDLLLFSYMFPVLW